MDRRFLLFVAVSAAFVAALLLVDGDGLPRQLSLGLATAAFLWLAVRRFEVSVPQVLVCIAVATTGEVILSLGWGLYTYAHAVIPLYVPPGHGLFYVLAIVTTRQPLVRRHARAIGRVVLVAGTILAAVSLVARDDAWGFLWWLGAIALIRTSRNQLLLSTCFVYTMILEWAGTAGGNWRWAAEVPLLRLHAANPPAGVGILYILLDLVVMAICAGTAGNEPERLLQPVRVQEFADHAGRRTP